MAHEFVFLRMSLVTWVRQLRQNSQNSCFIQKWTGRCLLSVRQETVFGTERLWPPSRISPTRPRPCTSSLQCMLVPILYMHITWSWINVYSEADIDESSPFHTDIIKTEFSLKNKPGIRTCRCHASKTCIGSSLPMMWHTRFTVDFKLPLFDTTREQRRFSIRANISSDSRDMLTSTIWNHRSISLTFPERTPNGYPIVILHGLLTCPN